MPKTFKDKHNAAINRDAMLRHSSNYFDSETRRIRFRQLHPEIFERVTVRPFDEGIKFLRRDRA